jgi:hypothetical protein
MSLKTVVLRFEVEVVRKRGGRVLVAVAAAGEDVHQRICGSRTGSGLNNSVSTTENIAALTPTPRPMESTATRVKPGLRRSHRTA